MFKDRLDAALQLSKRLEKYKYKNGIVLAVPRGGVPIGHVIAKSLGLPLEVILSKKIGHPYNSEFAIGSVSLHGTVMNDSYPDVPESYVREEGKRILEALKEKYRLYAGKKKPTNLKNKIVIIVDDGIATGNTLLATIDAVKRSDPKEVVIAVPVAPLTTVKKLSKSVNELICLLIPEFFMGVGQFYEDFSQVSDEEVINLLKDAQKVENA